MEGLFRSTVQNVPITHGEQDKGRVAFLYGARFAVQKSPAADLAKTKRRTEGRRN